MNVQKLNEILRNFDLIKHDFSSNTKRKKLLCLYLYCFGPKHKFERNGSKISFWGSNWIRKFLYGFLHDVAGSVNSTTYKGLGYCYV